MCDFCAFCGVFVWLGKIKDNRFYNIHQRDFDLRKIDIGAYTNKSFLADPTIVVNITYAFDIILQINIRLADS